MVSSNNAIYNTVGASISGVTNTLTVTNPSNTASSAARETITVGGGTAGDPTLNFNVSGVTNFEMGLDNSVTGDPFKIAASTALGTTDTFIMTTAGQRTMPLHPAFWAGATTAQNNVTGDGTAYTIIFNSVQFDQNSNFDGTSTFTAPVTGKYFFYTSTTLQNLGAGNTASFFFAVNGVTSQALNLGSVGVIRDTANNLSIQQSGFLNLTATNTVVVKVQVGGGAKVVSVLNTINETKFTGFLVC